MIYLFSILHKEAFPAPPPQKKVDHWFKLFLAPKNYQKTGWPRMVLTNDLPTPPILQKEAFLAKKKQVYDLPFFCSKKGDRS